MTHRPLVQAGNSSAVRLAAASAVELYHDMRHANGEDFEFLFAAFLDSARADAEAVARAIERGELPIG